MNDLRAVAHGLLPEGDATSIETLALYADTSTKYLAAIAHAVRKARHLARQHGRDKVIPADVRAAIEGSVLPSDAALAKALGQGASRTPRGTPPSLRAPSARPPRRHASRARVTRFQQTRPPRG
jgi:hypothetical protein